MEYKELFYFVTACLFFGAAMWNMNKTKHTA